MAQRRKAGQPDRALTLAIAILLAGSAYAGTAHICHEHASHSCAWSLLSHTFVPDAPAAPAPVALAPAGWCHCPAIQARELPADRLTAAARAPPQ